MITYNRSAIHNSHLEKGSALVIALVVAFMMMVFATAYTELTTTQNKSVESSVSYATASESVMAGFDMARVVLINGRDTAPLGWDDELTASYNNSLTYSETETPITVSTAFTPTAFQWYRSISYTGGYFYASVVDNDDGDSNLLDDNDEVVILTVTSVMPDGSKGQVQALVQYKSPLYEPEAAILSGGDMRINGNPQVLGSEGTIWIDGNLDIIGNPTVAHDVIASGTVSGSGTIGGEVIQNGTRPDIPEVDPTDYYNFRDYKLASNGKVYNTAEAQVWDTATQGAFEGWTYFAAQSKWRVTGDVATGGRTYYIDGNVDISGSPGDDATPWVTTLIATGYISVSGAPDFSPNETGTLFISGKDIKISGNGAQIHSQSLMAAHEQIDISGTPDLLGAILAEDAVDTCTLVTSRSEISLEIGGNPILTYNGAMQTILVAGDPYVKIKGIKKLK